MRREKVSAAALAIVLSVSTIGCSKKEPQPAETTPTATPTPEPVAAAAPPDPVAEAKAVFDRKCVVCHGDHGAGDGPGAAALEPKPRAFADASWQASVTDDHIKKIIVEGGAAVGKSPGMPANPDLKGKDDVLAALVKHIRDFKK
jgi:mono/diheme cytochrome c family protein